MEAGIITGQSVFSNGRLWVPNDHRSIFRDRHNLFAVRGESTCGDRASMTIENVHEFAGRH
jgi:hypothetical protein